MENRSELEKKVLSASNWMCPSNELCEFSSFAGRTVGMKLEQIEAPIWFVVDSSECVDHRPFGASSQIVAEPTGMVGMAMEIVDQLPDACLDSSLAFVVASSLAAVVVVEIAVLPFVAFDEDGMMLASSVLAVIEKKSIKLVVKTTLLRLLFVVYLSKLIAFKIDMPNAYSSCVRLVVLRK